MYKKLLSRMKQREKKNYFFIFNKRLFSNEKYKINR